MPTGYCCGLCGSKLATLTDWVTLTQQGQGDVWIQSVVIGHVLYSLDSDWLNPQHLTVTAGWILTKFPQRVEKLLSEFVSRFQDSDPQRICGSVLK